MPSSKRKFPFKILAFIIIVLLCSVVDSLELSDFVEEQTIDWRFAARGEVYSPLKVFYLDVDGKSIAIIGNLAWDREYYAKVSEAAWKVGGARAIGIDYVFSDRGMPEIADWERFQAGTYKLAEFLFADPPPPVVLAAGYASSQDRDINGRPIVRRLPRVDESPREQVQPPEVPQFAAGKRIFTPPNVGLIDTIDGGMNKVPMFAPDGEKYWFNMSVELMRLWWGLPTEGVHVLPDRLEFVRDNGVVLASVPLIDSQDVEVNWLSHWMSKQNLRASFSDALAATTLLESDKPEDREAAIKFFSQMKDAVVLIGAVDPLLQDRAPTRLDQYAVPRVGIHGNLVRMFQSGQYLSRPPMVVEWLLVLLVSGLTCGLLMRGGKYGAWMKIAASVILSGYIGLTFLLFSKFNLILPLVGPVSAALATSFVLSIMQLVTEQQMRNRITNLFGTYVSPAIVERMIDSGEEPQLGGVEAPITSYFSDIEDFTRLSEHLPPAQLVEVMNDYLSTATDVITAQEGTLDKYVGDAVVAMFGAPVPCVDHAYKACIASQLVQEQVMEISARWNVPNIAHVRTRIGLNTGNAVVGNMGSRTRFTYTMMGDTVNLAARLEEAAKIYGVGTLVSDSTRVAAEKYGQRCVFRFLDNVIVKGRTHPVRIHEIVGLRDKLPPAATQCCDIFAAGLEKYFARDWDGALALFNDSARLEWYPVMSAENITPSLVFAERCRKMKANPPGSNWDGVFVMDEK